MTEHIVAVFETETAAGAAAESLQRTGIPSSAIRQYAGTGVDGKVVPTEQTSTHTSGGGFWSWLFGEESTTNTTRSAYTDDLYDRRRCRSIRHDRYGAATRAGWRPRRSPFYVADGWFWNAVNGSWQPERPGSAGGRTGSPPFGGATRRRQTDRRSRHDANSSVCGGKACRGERHPSWRACDGGEAPANRDHRSPWDRCVRRAGGRGSRDRRRACGGEDGPRGRRSRGRSRGNRTDRNGERYGSA
jgi:hypothetical protein